MIYVFLTKSNDQYESGEYNIGLLEDTKAVSSIKTFNVNAVKFREIINFLPDSVMVVGVRVRDILAEIMHKLCKLNLDLPDKLKFHWVPPYKLPIDDVSWIFNYGKFPEGEIDPVDYILSMANELDIDKGYVDSSKLPTLLATVYFKLVGDFNKLQ